MNKSQTKIGEFFRISILGQKITPTFVDAKFLKPFLLEGLFRMRIG